jgi:hypothetical protein
MALSQAQATTTGTGGRTQPFGQALALAAAIVAILSVAIVASSWLAGQGAATSKADALVQSSAIEFRAGEHAVGGSDPFMQQGAIQFRASEHAAGALSLAATQMLRGEAAGTGVQLVPQAPRAAGERYPTGGLQAPQKAAPVEITRGPLP